VTTTTLIVRTDHPDLAYKDKVSYGETGKILDGPKYGTKKDKLGTWWFWKVDYGSTTGWSAENYLEKATIISAEIDSYSPSSKIEVYQGESFTISFDFTNTGNTEWDFYAGASIWDSNGNEIINDWSGTISLQQGEQGSYSWTHTINTPCEYYLQFGVWKYKDSTLLDKEPSPYQNLIKVKQENPPEDTINFYTNPSSVVQ